MRRRHSQDVHSPGRVHTKSPAPAGASSGYSRSTEDDARDIASGLKVDRQSKRAGNIARATSVANSSAGMIRKCTYESSGKRAARSLALGSVGDESLLVAKRIQQLACGADVVVWISGDRFFATFADAASKVPLECRVGIYGTGVLLAEIEDDLRRFRARAG